MSLGRWGGGGEGFCIAEYKYICNELIGDDAPPIGQVTARSSSLSLSHSDCNSLHE